MRRIAIVTALALTGGALATPCAALNSFAERDMNRAQVLGAKDVNTDGEDPQREFDVAIKELEAGEFRASAGRFERILALYPKEPTVLTGYGLALEGLGQWALAEQAFSRALRFNKDKVLARAEHGVALAKLGRTQAALDELAELKGRAAACGLCAESGNLHDGVDEVEAALKAPDPAAPK